MWRCVPNIVYIFRIRCRTGSQWMASSTLVCRFCKVNKQYIAELKRAEPHMDRKLVNPSSWTILVLMWLSVRTTVPTYARKSPGDEVSRHFESHRNYAKTFSVRWELLVVSLKEHCITLVFYIKKKWSGHFIPTSTSSDCMKRRQNRWHVVHFVSWMIMVKKASRRKCSLREYFSLYLIQSFLHHEKLWQMI